MKNESTLNERMRALCEAKGITFKPWQWPLPWEVGDDELCPYPASTGGAKWWPKLLELRRKLKNELAERPSWTGS